LSIPGRIEIPWKVVFMKSTTFLLFALLQISGTALGAPTNKNEPIIIHSHADGYVQVNATGEYEKMFFKPGGKDYQLPVECGWKGNICSFITPFESLNLRVNEKDTIHIAVIYKNTDTVSVVILGVPRKSKNQK